MSQIQAWRESPGPRILHDSDASLEALHDLAMTSVVTGGMINDAQIAACCIVSGIDELWTVDRVFSRFPQLRCRNPLST